MEGFRASFVVAPRSVRVQWSSGSVALSVPLHGASVETRVVSGVSGGGGQWIHALVNG